MYESTKQKLSSKIDQDKVAVQNYSVEPDPEMIENEDTPSSKNEPDSAFLMEGTPIEIIT